MRRFAIPLLLLAGCSKPAPVTPSQTTPYREVRLDAAHRLWIYTPKGGGKRRPLVVIAPAGAHMFDGMSLGEGDVPEHLPYVEGGYVVVAYDVSGPIERAGSEFEAARAFMAADAGVADGKRAIDFALRTLDVDPGKIAVAGHSSAATIALTLAQNDPRVKACLAYAPVIDVPGRLGETLPALEQRVPGITDQLTRFSPLGKPQEPKSPTLIFHAREDDNVPRGPIVAFAASRPNIKLIEVPSGGHYDSMIAEGIPAGMAFLKAHGIAP